MAATRGPAVVAKSVRLQLSCSASVLERCRTCVSPRVRAARARTRSGSGATEVQFASGIDFRGPNTGRYGRHARGASRISVRPRSRTCGQRRGTRGTARSIGCGAFALVSGLAGHDSRVKCASSATTEAGRAPTPLNNGFYRRDDRSGKPSGSPGLPRACLVRNFPRSNSPPTWTKKQ